MDVKDIESLFSDGTSAGAFTFISIIQDVAVGAGFSVYCMRNFLKCIAIPFTD